MVQGEVGGKCGGCIHAESLTACMARHVANEYLRHPSTEFIVGSWDPAAASRFATSVFHPSRAPLLLPPTASRLKRGCRAVHRGAAEAAAAELAGPATSAATSAVDVARALRDAGQRTPRVPFCAQLHVSVVPWYTPALPCGRGTPPAARCSQPVSVPVVHPLCSLVLPLPGG